MLPEDGAITEVDLPSVDSDLVIYEPTRRVPPPPEWVWENRIPRGMVTLLDGDPGLGKSTLTLDIAARVTRGDDYPDGTPGTSPGGVVLLSAEDDPERTIQPRLLAADADVDRVRIVEGKRDIDETVIPLEIPGDIDMLRSVAGEIDARLIVIDPFVAYLDSRIDSHRDAQVRRAMSALKLLAQECRAAVLLIRHLNKNPDNSNALYRGGGSIGIIAHARAGMVVGRSKDDDSLLLAQSKLNIGKRPQSMSFEVVPWEEHPAWGRVRWGEARDISADELLGKSESQQAEKLDDAGGWLLAMLDNGPVRSSDLDDALEQESFSHTTFRRARTELQEAGLIDKRKVSGPDAHWEWFACDAGGR